MDVRSLNTQDAAYIAGIIDGEGTITLTRKHANENRQFVISISNTDKGLLEYVYKTIGAGKITRKRVTRPNHTPSFTYGIYNRQALVLLEQIHPFLRTYKTDRATLMLRDYIALTPRNGKYTEDQIQDRRRIEAAVLRRKPGLVELEESIESQMR